MTREEAIKWLTNIKDKFIHGGDEAFDNARREALDMAIKALEHEPNLDKIRAEIKGMTPTYHNHDWSITDLVPMSEVLKLVDKYNAESEVEE